MKIEKNTEDNTITLKETGINVFAANKLKDEFGELFSRFMGFCTLTLTDNSLSEEGIKRFSYLKEIMHSSYRIDITKYDDSVSCTVKYNGYYNTHTGKTDSTLVVIFEFNEGESSNNLNIASNIELLISNIKQKYAQRYIEG